MLQFILNQNEIRTDLSPGLTLLDFIRYNQHLTGTKIGCREGDCGACSILIGEIKNGHLQYSSATSCLMPLANAQGKHIVTIEGINKEALNTVQEAFAEAGATQCGFCTPGFIISLTGHCINETASTYDSAIDAMNGNICRCTGYKSIERAAASIHEKLGLRKNEPALQFAVKNNIIPDYFLEIKNRLLNLTVKSNGQLKSMDAVEKYMGGGTDLYVQQHDTIAEESLSFLYDKQSLKTIELKDAVCEIGASATVTDLATSAIFIEHFPSLKQYIKLISSTQIRNMATIAGNFVNASPIGDLTIFFLALNTEVQLNDGNKSRVVSLDKFYKGYKQLDKLPGEYIEMIKVALPASTDLFNFEKVCKRTYLDIASVNSAMYLKMNEDEIVEARLSAGGVGPVPTFLSRSSDFLHGKRISSQMIHALIEIVQTEISPISDARGTETYKRFLLEQLIKAHFIKMFPLLPLEQLIYN